MKTCKCKDPKITKNSAYGKDFYVCAKSKDGCGHEMDNISIMRYQFNKSINSSKNEWRTPIFSDDGETVTIERTIKLDQSIDFIIADISLDDIKVSSLEEMAIKNAMNFGAPEKLIFVDEEPIDPTSYVDTILRYR